MSLSTRRTPERQSPFFSGLVLQKGIVPLPTTGIIITTALTPVTLTSAQLLTGWLNVDCQDAGTLTLPTATLLNAAIPGVEVGTILDFTVINYGDTTLTIGLGTGVTKTTIATVAAVMTIVTLASKRFRLECTGINGVNGATADAWVVWASGSTAAAVA